VSSPLSSLNDDDIRKITLLVETLEKSTFDFLQLQVGDLKLTIGTGNIQGTERMKLGVAAGSSGAEMQPPVATPAPSPTVSTPPPSPSPPAWEPKNQDSPYDGTMTITAPIIGRFYEKPEPGAAPFVKVGSEVEEDTTVCLIEVMKLFQAVRSSVSGVITEICVQDAQIVEYGQVLFRVRPRQ
jgi:acetyl-CoA carboxylase biotin carboxyl carrier protein